MPDKEELTDWLIIREDSIEYPLNKENENE
jgi:hypothetical protein